MIKLKFIYGCKLRLVHVTVRCRSVLPAGQSLSCDHVDSLCKYLTVNNVFVFFMNMTKVEMKYMYFTGN